MAPLKCCVNDCDSTSTTQKLFCMPMNDKLRSLWMSFLVPVNPYLLGLTKSQLVTKRVCQRHFDKTQFDCEGVRIRYSYPCLFTEKEIFHGVPLSSEGYNVLSEHNYCSNPEQEDLDDPEQEPTVLMGTPGDVHLQDHLYTIPVTSRPPTSTDPSMSVGRNEGDQQQPVQPTTDASTALSSVTGTEGASISRRTLADISQKENIELDIFQSSQPSTSKGASFSRRPLADISQRENIERDIFQSSQPSTSKGIPSMKQFPAKTRRFMRETTKIATNSLGQTSAERLKSAQKQAECAGLMENFDKLTKKAKAFLLMQLRLARKNRMARRFSLEDKLFALALMKQSPKGYKLLESIFALPTKRTLARLAEKIVFDCGINENTFNHIRQCTKHWDVKKRLCSLVFDEVALTPHLTFNEKKDSIHGFVEIAGERKPKFADHALVFMIRGICSSWRQSIAYYFCEGTVSAPELEKILKEIIPKLFDAGLKPLALVCDQGSTFRSCYKNLKEKTARLQTSHENRHEDTVMIAGHELFIFHDPPHLLKGIRNNFLDKDILFEGKRASWKDIMYIYDLDNKSDHTKALPKLTAYHVDPSKIKKMKVKVAAQVLSARTAAMLNYTHALHARLNTPMETMETTAALVLFFDELFDSVNGSPGQSKGKLRCAVKENSPHRAFWQDAIKKIKNIQYIDFNSKLAIRAGKPRYVRVPSLNGWITTLNSFLGLSRLLFSDYKIDFFYPRLINQDPLENFFGRLRAMNCRNVNPDVNQFIYSFKSLVISNILSPQSQFANCEDDDGETLIDLNYLFTSTVENYMEDITANAPPSSSSLIQNREIRETTIEAVISEKIKVQTSAYTAGYMCRKMTKKFHCAKCKETYTAKEMEGIHELIRFREYKRLKNSNLSYPNGRLLRLYNESAQIIHNYLNLESHENSIKQKLIFIIGQRCDISWLGCKKHVNIRSFFINLMIRLHVHNWCNIINKILYGKVEEKYISKMHSIHIAALKKYKSHRLRQKSTKGLQ